MSTPEFSGPSWQDEPDLPGDRSAYRRGGGGRHGGLGSRDSYSNGSGYSESRSRAGGGRAGRAGRRDHRYGSNGIGDRTGNDGYGGGDAPYRGGPAYKVSGGDGYNAADYGESRQYGQSGNGLAGGLVPLPGGGGRGGRRGGRGGGGRGGGGGGGWGPDDPEGPTSLYPYGRPPRGYGEPGYRPVRTPGGPRRRQPGSWWRHWTLKKVGLLASALALTMVLVMIAGFFYVYSSLQLPIQALSAPLQQSTQVYFADGKTPVGCFCSTNRTVLTYGQLSKDRYLEQAFFAAEDRHFLTEGGISITGTLRAILVTLSGGGEQGGSTITEQYVKTYFQQTSGNLTYKEKLKEIIYAIKLAKAKSKPWILTHYLNAVYLGNGAYGVEAAAQTYFGKHAWQLNAAQSAMLAAMVQEPSGFDPRKPAQNAPGLSYSLLDRWIYTLGNMARDKLPNGQPALSQAKLNALVPDPHNPQADLKNFPKLNPGSAQLANWSGFRGYIMNAVMNELQNKYHYTAEQIDTQGLQVTTTYNLAKMKALYAAVKEAKHMMRQYGQGLPWYAHIGGILENPKTGGIEASYGGPGWNAKDCKKVSCQYDMAMISRNQVGSSFKPYVLAAAVKQGMNVQTSVLNGYSPLCVPPETQPMTRSKRGPASSCPHDGVGWLPVSYDPVVEGPVSVVKAAALSSNAAFEDLAHRVGTKPIIHLAKEFGVNIGHAHSSTYPNAYGSGLRDDVGKIGIALGIAPLTVEEQATTFATLADGGVYHSPHVIAKITENGQVTKAKVTTRRVLTAAQAADVNWALSYDTIYGTGYPNATLSPARPTIAKTGTTDVAQSAFFIGAFPAQYSLAFGMFTNSQNNVKGGQTLDILPSIGNTGGGYGGAWPATMWKLYMNKLLALKSLPVAQLNPLQLNGFQKWVQVTRPKPTCHHGGWGGGGGQGGGGNGNGGGHGHHQAFFTAYQPCQPNPSPSPPVSGSPPPSPGPSPSNSPPGSRSPSPSPSPSPSKSHGPAQPANQPARQQVTGTPSLTTSAILQRLAYIKPGWTPLSTGFV